MLEALFLANLWALVAHAALDALPEGALAVLGELGKLDRAPTGNLPVDASKRLAYLGGPAPQHALCRLVSGRGGGDDFPALVQGHPEGSVPHAFGPEVIVEPRVLVDDLPPTGLVEVRHHGVWAASPLGALPLRGLSPPRNLCSWSSHATPASPKYRRASWGR